MKKIIILLFILNFSCVEKTFPKPKGELRLEFPTPKYTASVLQCPFSFENSMYSKIEDFDAEKCWLTIHYPKMKGSLYVSYYNLKTVPLKDLILQTEKIVFEHSKKASSIKPKIFSNPSQNVYGTVFELGGASATNFQFYVTDSTKNFLQASFYFRSQPKPDSLQPAVEYIKNDIYHLIETLQWR